MATTDVEVGSEYEQRVAEAARRDNRLCDHNFVVRRGPERIVNGQRCRIDAVRCSRCGACP